MEGAEWQSVRVHRRGPCTPHDTVHVMWNRMAHKNGNQNTHSPRTSPIMGKNRPNERRAQSQVSSGTEAGHTFGTEGGATVRNRELQRRMDLRRRRQTHGCVYQDVGFNSERTCGNSHLDDAGICNLSIVCAAQNVSLACVDLDLFEC